MTRATTNLPPLAEPDELATWLGVPADDANLMEALRAASARFRGAVRHPVSLVTDDEIVLDTHGTASVQLPAAPVVALHAAEVNGADITADCSFSRASGLLRRHTGTFPDRLGCLTVTYDHGHDPVPADIAEVVIDQARAMYAMRPGVSQVQTASESVSFGQTATVGVTAQWSEAIERHRLNLGDDA